MLNIGVRLTVLQNNFAGLDRDSFIKYAVCPKCSKVYDMKDCTETDQRGRRVVKHCNFKRFPRRATCGAPLAKKVVLSNGRDEFYPLKVYCYNSVKEKLQEMLMRDNFPQLCESWRDHSGQEGYVADITDGQVWKDFQTVDGKPFLSAPRNYMFMLNLIFSSLSNTGMIILWESFTWQTSTYHEVFDLSGRI